jgi:hypothetical protein
MDTDPDSSGVVRYEMDWEEYWRAREVCWRAATGRLFLRLVPLTGLVAILTGGVLVALEGPADLAPAFWLFGAAFLSTRLVRRAGARREWRRRPHGAVVVEWGAAGLSVVEGGGERRELPWDRVRVLLLTSEGFLAEGAGDAGVWLPFSGFARREEVDRFEAAARARGTPILDRSGVG